MMILVYDLIAVFVWPFKLAYWAIVYSAKGAVLLARGTIGLVVGIGLPALRFLAFVFILVATIALVADLTPMLDGFGSFQSTRFVEHWRELAPKSVAASQKAVSDATHPVIWNLVISSIIHLPTFVLFGLFGLAASFAGRRREPINVFVN